MAAWNPRANEIFADAIELTSPNERQEYIDRACGGDAALRQLVESLLAAHAHAGSFLDDPAVAASVAATRTHVGTVEPPTADHSVPAEDVGTRVGQYRLLQKLGEGGMGSVWVAEQSEPVRRRVALKLVKAGMDSERVLTRFEAERQALAMMDHTNIAKVFDAGTTETGRPYFAMELVKGVPITTYCDELHLSIRERLALFVDVCSAVQHAHHKGVIHRDIKPNNVLVAIQDGRPVPKVIDFGVAKALHTRLAERTLYTEIGAVIGTLEYMAPEQAELSALDVDTRADVYALGALLYELLTGTTPIGSDRLRTAGFAEVLRLIREEEPPRPSTRLSRSGEAIASLASKRRTEPRKLGSEVRGELDWIVMKCLEKDRTRRYETASGLAKDVERFLADQPVEACPPGAGYRFRKWLRRNKAAAIATAVVLVAVVLAVAGQTWNLLRAQNAERQADEARAEAVQDRDRAREAEQEALKASAASDNSLKLAMKARGDANQARDDALKAKESTDAALLRSDGLRLGSEALLARPNDPGLALLLGLEAVRRYSHPLTFNALYDAAAELRERRCVTADVTSLRFLRPGLGGKVLVGTDQSNGSGPGAAALYDPATGKKLAEWKGFGSGLTDLDWSADGTRAVAATTGQAGIEFTDGLKPERATFTDRAAYVWDATTGREVVHLRRHDDKVVSCRFSPDGTKIVTASWDQTARIWDVATGKELHVLRGHTRSLLTALFTPDGRQVLTVSAQTKDSAHHRDDAGRLLPDREPNSDPGVQTRPYRSGSLSSGGSSEFGGPLEKPFARLWDAASGQQVGTLTIAKGSAGLLDFTDDRPLTAVISLDGKWIAVGFHNDMIGVWDAGAGGEPVHILRGHGGRVTAIAFSPDGKRLASGGDRPAVFIWDLEEGRLLRRLDGHDQTTVYSVQFSRDGSRVVSAAADRTARVWEVASGLLLAVLRGHTGPVRAAHFLGDGDTVVTAGDRTVRVWSVRPPMPVPTLLTGGGPSLLDPVIRLLSGPVTRSHTAQIDALTFSPDGRVVLTGGSDWTARLWDAETGRPRGAVAEQLRGQVRRALFSPDGKTVYLGTEANRTTRAARGEKDTLLSMVNRWEPTTASAPRFLKDQSSGVAHMSLSPDGRRLLVVSTSNGLSFTPSPRDPLAYGFSGASESGTVGIWEVETGQRVATLPRCGTYQMSALPQFSPDGQTVLLADPRRNDLLIVDAGTGAVVRILPAQKQDQSNEWALAEFSPDGRTVAARKAGGRCVSFWAAGTGELLGAFEIPGENPSWEAVGHFSPDSKTFAVVSDRVVHLVDVATRAGVRVLRGHEAKVNVLAFSPDGTRLLTGSDDRSAAVWEMATGRIIALYKGHPGPVRLVAYSPDGRRVATASTDTLARVWPVDLLPEFERRKPRELTTQERERYEIPSK